MGILNKYVREMRCAAKQLIPWTYPKVNFEEEQEILALKQRTFFLDGYPIGVLYSEADYDDCIMKSVQIQSAMSPFLPFNLVCKIGKAFLGTKNISYIEFYRNNRKVYCWTVRVRNGVVLSPGQRTKQACFEGFQYRILHPNVVNLY